nr:MAG TPA: hypothetical protein [Microviridae sp.]
MFFSSGNAVSVPGNRGPCPLYNLPAERSE